MSRLAFILVALMGCGAVAGSASAQSVSYALNVVVERTSEIGSAAAFIRSSVASSALEAGIAASPGDNNAALFETTVALITLTSSVVRTPDPRIVVEVQLDLNSRQVGSRRSHGTFSTSLRGMGPSESDAFVSAIRSQPNLRGELANYFQKVREDINGYFESACGSINQNAMTTAHEGNYQAAIFALAQVPPGAQDCWTQSQELLLDVIDDMVDQQCSAYLLRARSQWSASKGRESAEEVARALTQFYPNVSCNSEVEQLLNDVSSTIARYDRAAAARYREKRDRAIQVYNDQLADKRTNDGRAYKLAESRVEARRAVGVELAKSWAQANVSWISLFK